MRRYRACDTDDERGVALVEFALVLPIVLVILMGMLDFGKAFNYWLDETQLSSAGARWAAVNNWPGKVPADGAQKLANYIQSQADTSELLSGGTSATKARVCVSFPVNPTTGTSGKVSDPVTVTVDTTYRWLAFLGKFARLPTSTALKATSTMRLEAAWSSTSTICST